MLDVKLLREKLDEVKARMATRGTLIDWDEFVRLDRERREALANVERLKEKKNQLSGAIGKLILQGDSSLERQARLAYTARSDNSEQPALWIKQHLLKLAQFNLPSDQRR